MLYWDAVVKQARDQDIGLGAQEVVHRSLKLDFGNLLMNWGAVKIGHVNIVTSHTRHDVPLI